MDKQLSGGFRYIQVILKELVDSGKSFLIHIIRYIVAKDFFNKNLAQINGQLIDQTADTQLRIGDYTLFRIEDLSYIHSHRGFLVGLGYLSQLSHNRTVSYTHVHHGFAVHHINNHVCRLLDGFHVIFFFQSFDENNIPFIHRSDIITILA